MASKATQKGYRTSSAGTKIFLSKGYIGRRVEKSGKFAIEKDLFGLWDFYYIKGKEHIFVQYKTNVEYGKRKPRKWLLPYFEFCKLHGSNYVKYEIWNKLDRKHFEVMDCQTQIIRIEEFIKNGNNIDSKKRT